MTRASTLVGLFTRAAFCTMCLLALATPLQAMQARDAPQSAPKHVKPGEVCFPRLFSRALPGKVDYCLGLHDWNHGHYDSALEFLTLAAGWGNKSAQYTLGLIYFNGHHVPAQPALGIAWLELANERHNDPQIIKVAQAVERIATPVERQRGEQLFRQLLPKYGDKVAAARAWHRLRNWWQHGRNDSGCVRLSGAQAAAARRTGLASVPPEAISAMGNGIPPSMPTGTPNKIHFLDAIRKNIRQVRTMDSQFYSTVCVNFATRRHNVNTSASAYFAGFAGVVTVGPLKAVPAQASSTEH